jgi:NADH-quinone oxidoreductase subunit C
MTTTEERIKDFEELLKTRFGVAELPADEPPLVPLERHHELARTLREERGYSIYGFVVASHWLAVPGKGEGDAGDPEHYEVATSLRTPGTGTHLAVWRVRVPLNESIASLVDLYPGADWQEREQYDLVGVRFRGHPDLRRLMMPEDWEGHPLRKDYAIETACPPWR